MAEKYVKMVEKWQLIRVGREDKVVSTHDTEAEVLDKISKVPADILGQTIYTYRKVFVSQ